MLVNDRNPVNKILENLRINESIPSDMKDNMKKHDGVIVLGRGFNAPTLVPSMKKGKWDYCDKDHPEDRPLTIDEDKAIKIFNAWKSKEDFKKYLKESARINEVRSIDLGNGSSAYISSGKYYLKKGDTKKEISFDQYDKLRRNKIKQDTKDIPARYRPKDRRDTFNRDELDDMLDRDAKYSVSAEFGYSGDSLGSNMSYSELKKFLDSENGPGRSADIKMDKYGTITYNKSKIKTSRGTTPKGRIIINKNK